MIMIMLLVAAEGGAFLDLNPSTQAQALGHCTTTIDDGGMSVFSNSSVCYENSLKLSVNHWIMGSNLVAAGLGLHDKLNIGIMYLNYGQLHEFGEVGEYLGEFTPYEASFRAGKCMKMWQNRLTAGVTLAGFMSHIDDYCEYGVFGNVGFRLVLGQFHAGITAQNLGSGVNHKTSLPTALAVGLRRDFGQELRLYAEVKCLSHNEIRCGIEYVFQDLRLRAGLFGFERINYTGGFAYAIEDYEISYAVLVNEFAVAHNFGVGVKF